MIRDLCGIHVAGLPPLADAGLSAPVKLKFLVLVVNEVHGKWPETEEQMVKNEGLRANSSVRSVAEVVSARCGEGLFCRPAAL